MPVTVGFGHHVKGSGAIVAGQGDGAEVQHVLKLVVGHCEAIRCQAASGPVVLVSRWHLASDAVDGIV